jgi:hypothetical protein
MSGRSDGGLSLKDTARLESRLYSSASWFYWIAILATIHGGAFAFRVGDVSFIGLGATRLIDQASRLLLSRMGATSPVSLGVLSMTGTLALSGIFTACGYLGMRHHHWAFITGIGLYTLDALVCVMVQDYIPLILHTGAIIALLRGLGSINKLNQADDNEPEP